MKKPDQGSNSSFCTTCGTRMIQADASCARTHRHAYNTRHTVTYEATAVVHDCINITQVASGRISVAEIMKCGAFCLHPRAWCFLLSCKYDLISPPLPESRLARSQTPRRGHGYGLHMAASGVPSLTEEPISAEEAIELIGKAKAVVEGDMGVKVCVSRDSQKYASSAVKYASFVLVLALVLGRCHTEVQ